MVIKRDRVLFALQPELDQLSHLLAMEAIRTGGSGLKVLSHHIQGQIEEMLKDLIKWGVVRKSVTAYVMMEILNGAENITTRGA